MAGWAQGKAGSKTVDSGGEIWREPGGDERKTMKLLDKQSFVGRWSTRGLEKNGNANPERFDVDPDPAFYMDADPDPAFYMDADPDPAFYMDSDPDPAFYMDADADPAFYMDADPVQNLT